MSDNALVPTTSALDRLKRTAQRTGLEDFVTARTRRSLLLIDVSSSMGGLIIGGEAHQRKIDKLRIIVAELRSTHPVPMVTFPGIELVDQIPEPHGMTPLHQAIDFAHMQEANHILLVTDGEPDSPNLANEAADRFGGAIDVFFIGNPTDPGAAFCAALAKRTGGSSGVTDLSGAPKQLAGKMQLLLGDGSSL